MEAEWAPWLAHQAAHLWGQAEADWSAALAASDSEALWNIWCVLVESLLLRQADKEELLAESQDLHRHRGRGNQARWRWEDVAA